MEHVHRGDQRGDQRREQKGDSAPLGVLQLDQQHRDLLRLLQRLERTLEADPGGALPEYRFVQLAEETSAHFQAEEAFLQAVRYPHLAGHRADHDRILEGFRKSLARWDAPGAPLLVDLVREFAQAAQAHLETEDQALALWLAEAPGNASGRQG
jgi:hemerythrin